MTHIIIALITCLFTFSCCSTVPGKIVPDYDGVDLRAKSLVDEYLWLSKQNNIYFDRSVTVGFTHIHRGDVVGLCTYGGSLFREIDIDINYWNHSTNSSKMALLFHELSHCYCRRDHDYGKGTKYPEEYSDRLKQAFEWMASGGDRPGFWDDGCPVSFMYPSVLDDDCTRAHYDQYVKEMFERCRPWR